MKLMRQAAQLQWSVTNKLERGALLDQSLLDLMCEAREVSITLLETPKARGILDRANVLHVVTGFVETVDETIDWLNGGERQTWLH
jgi:hypothetical protein